MVVIIRAVLENIFFKTCRKNTQRNQELFLNITKKVLALHSKSWKGSKVLALYSVLHVHLVPRT